MPIVDTLRLKTRLSDSGMPESQAQALVEELDEALSTAVTAQVATKVEVVELRAAINAVREHVEERFEQVDKRFEQVDKRFEQVDKRFEQVDKRFEQVDRRLDDLKAELLQTRADVAAVKGDVKVLRWMGGTILVVQLGILVRLLFS